MTPLLKSSQLKTTIGDLNELIKDFSEKQISITDKFQKELDECRVSYNEKRDSSSQQSEEDFNIDMSLSLTGIGAELSLDKNITTIKRLIENGPAQKSGLLQEEDQVIGVAQGNKEFINILVNSAS